MMTDTQWDRNAQLLKQIVATENMRYMSGVTGRVDSATKVVHTVAYIPMKNLPSRLVEMIAADDARGLTEALDRIGIVLKRVIDRGEPRLALDLVSEVMHDWNNQLKAMFGRGHGTGGEPETQGEL